LQGHGDAPAELVDFAFDLPHLDVEDKARLPLLERARAPYCQPNPSQILRPGQPLALDHADPRLLIGGILEHKSGRDIRALNREVAQQMLLRR
jgi:hypothetical protein